MKTKANRIKEKIDEAEKILVVSHISPDGDSIGSILGLGLGLQKEYTDKTVHIAIADMIPGRYSFLKTDNILFTKSSEKYDTVFVLDCGDLERAGMEIDEKKVINIDHHITNPEYGELTLVKPDASSTSEIVGELLKELGIELDKDIAESLYTGITSDTGSFKYSNTTGKTHRIAADLLDTGIDIDKISTKLYQNRSVTATKLMKEAIDNMKLFLGGKIVFLEINQEILDRCGANVRDSDMLVEFLRDMEGVEISILLKPLEKGYKGSLRSKTDADVSGIASEFGGGGHVKAAGFASTLPKEEIVQKLVEYAKDEIKRISARE